MHPWIRSVHQNGQAVFGLTIGTDASMHSRNMRNHARPPKTLSQPRCPATVSLWNSCAPIDRDAELYPERPRERTVSTPLHLHRGRLGTAQAWIPKRNHHYKGSGRLLVSMTTDPTAPIQLIHAEASDAKDASQESGRGLPGSRRGWKRSFLTVRDCHV